MCLCCAVSSPMAVRRLVYHYSNVVIVLLALSCSEERYIKSAVGVSPKVAHRDIGDRTRLDDHFLIRNMGSEMLRYGVLPFISGLPCRPANILRGSAMTCGNRFSEKPRPHTQIREGWPRVLAEHPGPYIVVLKNVYNCEAYEQLAWSIKARISHFKPAHPFEPTRITGNVTGTVPLDDSLVSSFILDRRSNNQWKENALVINFPKGTGCSSIFVNGPYIASLLGDLYSPSPCKVQPGFHTFADMPVKIQHPNVPVFAYGEYRLHFLLSNIGKTHEPLLCYSGEVNLIPKP